MTSRVSSASVLPSCAILVSAVLWGSVWIPLRQIAETGMSGVWASLLVYGAPLIVMLPLVALGRGRLGHFGLAALWVGATSGICNTFYAIGVVYGSVGKVVLLFYLNPIWSAILEWLVLKTPVSRTRLATIVLGFAGMAVLVGNEGGVPLPHGLAEWFGVLASVFWALSLIGMALSGSTGVIPKTFFQFLFGLLASSAILLLQWFPGQLIPPMAPLAAAAPWAVGAVLIWIVPGMALSFWAVGRMSPTRAAILFMFEAIVGVLSAAILTDEPFGWREITGGLMILGAGLLDVVSGAMKRPAPSKSARKQFEGAR
ncbi:MAG TPA: DMT family transporter [Dongiaceae bacterium]|nr:DMT family transporter [Dongiaceae bacterium]